MADQNREVKKSWESKVIQTHRVFPGDVNSHRTLFGGRLMSYIDDTASISASRHSRSDVVTASMDTLDFLHPLNENHSVCIESYVTGVGSTSMEVFCKIMGEDLSSGERYLAATSFITFVAVAKEKGKKQLVPLVEPSTKEEKFVCEGYEARKAQRMSSRSFHEQFAQTITDQLPWSN
ncbi:acyl-CoA thioesterase [Mycobacteroides abscessus]|uniref:acyl-CoA thioesterase n=1 Tax=Desemzia sp. FAM 23989 TaxID=3259523 RepID=UPI001A99383C